MNRLGVRRATVAVAIVAVSLTCATACRAGDYLWWEGERPAETNFPGRSWFDPSTFKDTRHLLSGGDWLSASGKRGGDELFARYHVDVPADGSWTLWARKFWKHGPFRWRFDDSPWQTCGRDVALADNTYLKEHVGANWVRLGQVTLRKGRRVFELRLLAGEGESATACFDCFLLTQGPFMPRGHLKPDAHSGKADEGCFAWEPMIDRFPDGALVNLRGLNETEAGRHGFVRREGGGFVLGSGEPVRFWAVNVGPGNIHQNRESVDYLARKLAKSGVNLVRYHGPVYDDAKDPADVDRRTLDDLFYMVAAMKAQGIYTQISFHFPLWFDVKPHYGIEGFEGQGNKKPFALLYFNPRMQAIHRAWARGLLTTRNPYTGMPLGRDPAVAIVEIINEDSLFFWTFAKKNIPDEHWRHLESLFEAWLTKRYGSVDKALARWGGTRRAGDVPAQGRAELLEAWHMTRAGLRQGGPDKVRRVGDQVRFLAERQREFYEATVRFYKKDLKVGSLVSCSNWHTADPDMLDALERYTYTAGDVIDRHGYFGGAHKGDGASYSVRVGHTFGNLAAVTVPERLPLGVNQVAGYPQIISEIGWTNPNRYRADCTFLSSAYGSLQGVDGIHFFAVGSNLLADTTMQKFAVSCPVIAGTFPAAALQYRRGDVTEAPAVVRQELRLDDLYAMKGSSGAAAQALDAVRGADVPRGEQPARSAEAFDPLAFYAGRVERTFGDRSRTVVHPRLAALIDRDAGVVRSVTGELTLDFRRGLATVNTPRSRGAAGFLGKAGRIELGDVTIECGNEYAAIQIISLDGKPLAESARILIQAMTEERPYGFRTAGNRIAALGGWPFGLKTIDATVTLTLKGGAKAMVVALDSNGLRKCQAPIPATWTDDGRLSAKLSGDAVYHVVFR